MGKRKRRSSPVENVPAALFDQPAPSWSIGDPALAEFLGLTNVGWGDVTEVQALGITAYYRANALIAGTIAGLPRKVFETGITDASGTTRHEVTGHFITDSPAGPFDLPGFNWTEMLLLHLLNHGEGYLKHIHNSGGELIGLYPVHPLAITKVVWDGPDKVFTIATVGGGSEEHRTARRDNSDDDKADITQILGLTMDGLRGLSPLSLFRQSLSTTRAGETAANRQFTSGMLVAGLVSADSDIEEDEAKTIATSLRATISGAEHAGDVAFVNRALKFTPWMMTNADAEFLASRAFQVEEVSRMTGVPPHLLSSTEKVTSWGSGIAELDLGLQKYTLAGWTDRIEAALKRVLPPGQFLEFMYSGLLAGTPKQEIELLIAQVEAGLITVDEARAIRNLPALTAAQKADMKPPPPPAGAHDHAPATPIGV